MGAEKEEVGHTPTPWLAGKTTYRVGAERTINIGTLDSEYGVGCFSCIVPNNHADDITEAEHRANAEFIVRACNSHDELVAACEAALRHLNFSTTAAKELKKQLRAALSRAKGE